MSDVKLLKFYATWCGPCRVLGKVLDRVLPRFADELMVEEVNIDKSIEVASKYEVRSIPTLVLVKGDKEVARLNGAQHTPVDLMRWIEAHTKEAA